MKNKNNLIYLCGPINGCTDAQCNNWRDTVKEVLGDEFLFIDPMRRDYRGREHDCFNEIVEEDYRDIKGTDIVLAMANNPSWGTAMEIHEAFKDGKTVIVICDKPSPSPWLMYHCHVLVKSLELAISELRTAKT